jgi:signal transduction histidine kinase/ligand-binding sensor domain-containing protein
MRKALYIVLFLVVGCEAAAQQYHYSLRNYKAVEGLPQSQVKTILEDKNGYLWIGTEGGGLARFDGHTFRVYTTLDGLQSNIVNYLTFDSHDNLWVMHPRGISKFDGTSFKKFQQPGAPQNTSRLRRIFEFSDTLFFMSHPGFLGKIHNDSVYYWSKPMFGENPKEKTKLISFVRKGPEGELVFCIDAKSFYCKKGSESFWVHLERPMEHIGGVFYHKGRLRIQTENGVVSLDLKKRVATTEKFPIENWVLSYDSIKDVFWTFYGNDFLKQRVKDGQVKTDTVLRDTEVFEVFADSEGNTWFGSNGNGLYKYFIQDFDRCASERIRNVMAVYHDSKGNTWVGTTTKGLFRINKGKTFSFADSRNPLKNSIYSIAETKDGSILIGSVFGLGRYNPRTQSVDWERLSPAEWSPGVMGIQVGEEDDVWLSLTMRGVLRRNKAGEKKFTMDNGLRSNFLMTINYSSYHKALFMGDEFGLSVLQDDSVRMLDAAVENTSVIAIHPYRDSLLLLSTGGGGVVVFDPVRNSRRAITTQDGLASDFIYFTAPDENNDLWVGSEKGITRIKLGVNLEVTEHIHYDYENGLAGVETNQNAFSFFDGNKVFGLIDGLYIYNDPPTPEHDFFPLHLTDVQLFYGETPVFPYATQTEGFFNIPVGLSLPPDKNHITFRFNRVDKRSRKSIKFKYLLQGFDKKWSQPSSASEVTYSNLPPGDYTFLVLSSDARGAWNGRPLRYDFTIQTPFYAKTGFIAGAIVLVAALIALLLFLRVRKRVRHVLMLQKIRMKEQETVRKDIARDFHDEMGNQLSRIINYVSLLKLNGHNGNSHNQDLYTKVEESAKYLYTGTRDFIWSIDPGNDELSKLFIHIRDFGEKLFEEKQIKFRATNHVREQIRLPYGFSREANLIFKEAMTNAFKYSNASNVTLSLKCEDDTFTMCLEDDGVGFVSDGAQRGNGLTNLKERSSRIGVALGVVSIPNNGTKIFIEFKRTKKMNYGLTF